MTLTCLTGIVSALNIEQREVDDIMIFDVSDELDAVVATNIKQLVEKCIREKQYKIIINLKRVPVISSLGMGIIIASQVKLRKYGGDLRIANVSERNKEIFQLTKLNSIFELFDTESEALEEF